MKGIWYNDAYMHTIFKSLVKYIAVKHSLMKKSKSLQNPICFLSPVQSLTKERSIIADWSELKFYLKQHFLLHPAFYLFQYSIEQPAFEYMKSLDY